MAKSLRSKRKMRLRTIKREIAEPHYERQEQAKQAAVEAALAAPKVEVHSSSSANARDAQRRGRSGATTSAMEVEDGTAVEQERNEKEDVAAMETDIALKPTKKIKKRSKSKGRLKKEKHKQKKLKF